MNPSVSVVIPQALRLQPDPGMVYSKLNLSKKEFQVRIHVGVPHGDAWYEDQ